MPSPKDISSTERLLRLIRDKEQPGETSGTSEVPPSGKSRGNTRGLRAQKSVTVGVDIAGDEIRLVKVKQSPGVHGELLDCKRVLIESGLSRGTPAFAAFLRSELEAFCGSGRGCNVWGLIRSDKVDVENIRIPKVVKKQIENAVYWTAKKTTAFDEKKTILDFEIQGEVVEEGVTKLSVVICIASRREVEEMERCFADIGFPLTGLTAAPFALQNLFRADWMPLPDRAAILYIGDDSSRIDVFSKGNLVMTRDIRAGINSMADSLLEEHTTSSILSKKWGEISGGEVDSTQTQNLMNIEDARDLVFSLGFDSSPPYGEADRFGLSKEEIFEMIHPALERLVRQVERTLEHYTVIRGNEGIDFIYVFSDGGVCRPVVEYVGGQLRVESNILDPLSSGSGFSGGGIAERTSTSQRASLTSALGLALSSLSRTLNLIYTHSDKEKFTKTRRVNRTIFSVFAAAVLILVGLFFWMGNVVERKEVALTKLNQQVKRDTLAVEGKARAMVSEIDENRLTLKRFKERYWGVAVIGELSRLTPGEISLLAVKATMGKDTEEKIEEISNGMMISGVVTGSPGSLEAVLARYVLALKQSPILQEVAIDTHARRPFHAKEALYFGITVSFPGV